MTNTLKPFMMKNLRKAAAILSPKNQSPEKLYLECFYCKKSYCTSYSYWRRTQASACGPCKRSESMSCKNRWQVIARMRNNGVVVDETADLPKKKVSVQCPDCKRFHVVSYYSWLRTKKVVCDVCVYKKSLVVCREKYESICMFMKAHQCLFQGAFSTFEQLSSMDNDCMFTCTRRLHQHVVGMDKILEKVEQWKKQGAPYYQKTLCDECTRLDMWEKDEDGFRILSAHNGVRVLMKSDNCDLQCEEEIQPDDTFTLTDFEDDNFDWFL